MSATISPVTERAPRGASRGGQSPNARPAEGRALSFGRREDVPLTRSGRTAVRDRQLEKAGFLLAERAGMGKG